MRPFSVAIPQSDVDDLHRRLDATRWPSEIPDVGWSRGVPPAYLKDLAQYWRNGFDWRAAEAKLNAFPQFVTEIDGANIHFFHVRSPEPDATPLILTHGWPSTAAEFIDVIGPLTDPRSHGGDPATAYHVVAPTLPGFGFSGPAPEAGWDVVRIAGAWAQLMTELGYERFVTHGGDLGTWISLTLAGMMPDRVIGSHVNFLITAPTGAPDEFASFSESDFGRLQLLGDFAKTGSGYMHIQSTKPQTLAYGLTDSPVGQLAWITEKFQAWSDCEKIPEDAISRDALLTTISIYWFTATAGSSAQLYYELADQLPTATPPPPPPPPLPTPVGVAVFPGDAALPIRSLADRGFPQIVQWSEFDRGGHFPAMEEPDLFVADLQAFSDVLPR